MNRGKLAPFIQRLMLALLLWC